MYVSLTHLHNIGFVDSCNFVTAILFCVCERKFSYSSRCLLSDQLDALHHSIHNLMFNAWVFTLCVLADCHNIYIFIKGLIPFQWSTWSYICIEIKLPAEEINTI